MKRSVLIAMSVGLAYAFPAHAQKQVAKTFTMPVQVHAAVGFSDCSNSPGPQITLDGSITLGGLNVELIFRNNVKGTHTYVAEQTAEVVAVPVGGALVIPKQPPLGGVGGNPFIWLQFLDGDGNAWIAYYSPSWLAQRHGLPAQMTPSVSALTTMLEGVAAKVARLPSR